MTFVVFDCGFGFCGLCSGLVGGICGWGWLMAAICWLVSLGVVGMLVDYDFGVCAVGGFAAGCGWLCCEACVLD